MPDPFLYHQKELLLRIADGDEAAFTQFFRDVSPYLKAHLTRIVRDPDGLMEVLQETFIKIWLHRDVLPEVVHLKAYIKKMASNEAFTFLRKQASQIGLLKAIPVEDPGWGREIEETLSYKETASLIQQAIGELPAQRRRIYEMSRLGGLKAPQIAAELNLSSSYVRTAIHAAQQHIRAKLLLAGKSMATVFFLL